MEKPDYPRLKLSSPPRDHLYETVQKASHRKHAASTLHFEGIKTLQQAGDLNFLDFTKPENTKDPALAYLQDFQSAARIFDPKKGPGKIDPGLLKKRAAAIDPTITDKDIMMIANANGEITAEHYYELCKEYDLEGHDPLAGGFKFFDDGNGHVDFEIVNKLFEMRGIETLKKKDIEILHELLDVDKDGRVALDDFKRIFKHLGR